MSNIAIKAENLGKAYQLGQIGTGTISRDLERWYARMRGKEDPFLRIGEANHRSTKGESDIVWSLRDLNFEIEQGDAVGIIGRNGAGKSTLLKILSKVTAPTTGKISGHGRIASLLEVGTGFHPELSGRENIFLNGAILGMRKREIQRKFDEIVDFAGIERYIDTPVKRYSSGMYVRLAFAVAAYLESEILIVDEVLAVGDAEFQKKCLGKMGEISKGEGRTVLFVSHNMQSISALCNNSIFLKNGEFFFQGKTSSVINKYMSENTFNKSYSVTINPLKKIQLTKAEIVSQINKKLIINLVIHSNKNSTCSLDFRMSDNMNNPFAFSSLGALNLNEQLNLKNGYNDFFVELSIKNLALGSYSFSIDLTKPTIEYLDRIESCLQFEIIKNDNDLNLLQVTQDWNYGSYQIPLTLIEDV